MTDENDTLGDVSHTNPYTGTAFGDTQAYSRGSTVAADGGRPDSDDAETDAEEPNGTLADVEHTRSTENNAPQRTFDRGGDR